MKNTYILFLFFILILFQKSYAQKNKVYNIVQADAFYGIVLEHDEKLKHAIQDNPFGIIVSYDIKLTKKKEWASYYNYPDFGFSALYQDTNSTILGKMYGLYTHYNFYLNNRNAINKLQLKIAFGFAYNTTPFNKTTNNQNYALGSKINGSAYLKLNYYREFLKDKLGLHCGIALLHFSNAGFDSPNLGLNTLAATIGLNYNFNNEPFVFSKSKKTSSIKSKLDYNFILRTGLNESKNIGYKKYSFYVITFMMSKKINYKSTLTTGLEYFNSNFLKNFVDESEVNQTLTNKNKDRIGLFIGHEFKLNKIYVISQIGYNAYYPKEYVSRVYERFGFKYFLNKHIFTELSMKVNLFRAETLEFGIGIKL